MNLRDLIETALISSLGDSISPEKIGEVTSKILAIGRSKGIEITHQIGPNGFHRIIMDGEKSTWTPPTDIIRHGDFIATTDAFINLLPQVGKVFSLKSGKDFTTEAVQSLQK